MRKGVTMTMTRRAGCFGWETIASKKHRLELNISLKKVKVIIAKA